MAPPLMPLLEIRKLEDLLYDMKQASKFRRMVRIHPDELPLLVRAMSSVLNIVDPTKEL